MNNNGSVNQNGGDNFEDEPLLPQQSSSSRSSATSSTRATGCRSCSSIWSTLVFGWFTPVLEHIQENLDIGISPDIEHDDTIPPLPKDVCTDHVTKNFQRLWDEEQLKDHPSLLRCLWKELSAQFLGAGILKFVHDCLQFVGPQVLNGLILFLKSPTDDMSEGMYLTLAVTVAQLLMSLCLRHYFFRCYMVSLRLRTCVLYAIFQKSLKIDPSYYLEHPVGQVTNLMSVDVQRLQDIIAYLHAVWYSFLQIGLAMYFLWQQLGPSCLAGVAIILASIPLTGGCAKWMGKLQKKVMKRKDDRIQANQETLMNMKIVKLQAWEGPFSDKVSELRRVELKQLLHYFLARSLTWLLWSGVPLLIAVATFAAYVFAGHALDVASALTALALFQILRFPLFMLPNIINNLVEANVALTRIEGYLSAPEQVGPDRLIDDDKNVISLSNATFTYQNIRPPPKKVDEPTPKEKLEQSEKELLLLKARLADAEEHVAKLQDKKSSLKSYGSSLSLSSMSNMPSEKGQQQSKQAKMLCLRRVNFECKEGEFVVVVGTVGSGKSTLLRSILGEVQLVSGEVGVRGKIAYFDQKPFVMNDTVEGNILFGKPKDNEKLYKEAIECCSLTHDLSLLPNGDQCEIGERGITLSGGQKARLSMARVVYHDADISLLDDCLSAVDAHVGRDLFENCITKTLLLKNSETGRKKTVILVTNALQYLSHPVVDRIVVLKHGLVVENGSYKELIGGENSHFKSFLQAFTDSKKGDYNDAATDTDIRVSDRQEAPEPTNPTEQPAGGQTKKKIPEKKGDESEKGKLMTDEMAEREIGKVGGDVYAHWAKAAGGYWVVIPLFLSFTAYEVMKVLANWWLTYWSHAAEPDRASQLHFLSIHALINFAAILVDFLRMIIVLFFGLKASSKMFGLLLESCMHAPMSFFDTTPAGRIINRFSKDVNTLDETLPTSFRVFLNCLFSVSSTLVVVTSVTPIFAVVLVPMLFYYRRQQEYFSQSYRELKRIDSVTRSPIYALFGETLDGPATIRAFGAQAPLSNRMIGMIDRQQHAFFLTQAGLCWLAVRLELIGTLIIFAACAAAVFEKWLDPVEDEVFAGLAGLSISFALSVTQTLNWMVRVGSDFEANMVSVERIKQYCNLEHEAPHETEADGQVSNDWPTGGVIEFRDAQLRYRPGLPLVLKGLDLSIPSQSKVGIVGRTGAGKSTLMTALMRLVELDGGQIVIDGVDTSKLGLHRLRSSVAVIPQDPVLFSGTVKTNLDPFDHHSKGQLMDVLERVGLYSEDSLCAIHSLDDKILQDGENLSVGQRQLLVIARALLDGAGIVVCDEATASIDAEADARIQKVLRTDFANATTLTVAHRLNTIMDSTHILVMSDGRAAEFDTPANLLSKGGLFKDLVDKWEEEHES